MNKHENSRKSNIELLRILAALMVIILHYNYTGALNYVAHGGINEIILFFWKVFRYVL